jgi:hypothetical protein
MKHRTAGSRHLGGAPGRPGAIRRKGLIVLAVLAVCLAAAALGAADTTVTAEPIKQLSDRLEGPGQQELAGVLVTVREGEVTEI